MATVPPKYSSTSISGPTPDQEFFYEAVFIQVDSILFCVPREHIDVPGTTFSQMFADVTPSMSPRGPEGTHKNNPIILKGIDSKAFRCFLRVAWKREKRVRLKAEEWSSVLKLANLWNFEQIKHEAQDAVFNALQNDAFAMLKLGQEFEFKDWIMRGYAILSDPGFMMPLKALASNGLSDKIPDIIKAREAMRFYTQYDLRIMTGSPAYQNRIFECFSCHTGAPQCRLGAPSYLRHIEVCDPDLEQISWCKCKETLFPHPGVVVQFDDMVKLVVEEVFKDEIKHY